jgi:hypothetical protein
MELSPHAKLRLARQHVAERLSSMFKTWVVEGESVRGPGTLEVLVEDHHQCGETHLDIGFVVNRERADIPVLWDCVAGMGATQSEAILRAVETWSISTLPVYLEFLTGDGSFAEHLHADEPQGCVGWHVIHGPWIAYGYGAAPDNLQAWALDNPVLPVLGKIASRSFNRPTLNCVKLLFGFGSEDVAEVRINGEYDEATSQLLKGLTWPRAGDAAFARCYLLFVHIE